MICTTFVFLCFLLEINCVNFDIDNVQTITDASVKNAYFSYSLLLQKGRNPSLIVGSPKQSNGGGIFNCDLSIPGTPCTQYALRNDETNHTFNGNFLGMSLDGADDAGSLFIACAPRATNNYTMHGKCYLKKNSSKIDSSFETIDPVATKRDTNRYRFVGLVYDFKYSEVGLDVSYIQDKSEVLMSVPGIRQSSGGLVTWNIRDSSTSILPANFDELSYSDEYNYAGYKVTFGMFSKGKSYYIMGAPRANTLYGKVEIFQYSHSTKNKMAVWEELTGQHVGASFGSVIVATDVNNDGLDDLLVGAPTFKGTTYEEGYVEFYKIGKRGRFESGIKLFGNNKMGARFGSAITALGDVDLDGYNDVAISAPYEDAGKGAVYIYRGSSNGLITKYSQRLSPESNSNVSPTRGFGLGISRGNDIDDNGHNDLAIGAYQSSQVFIYKTKTIVDVSLKLSTNVTTLDINWTAFKIIYCVSYKKRHNKPDSSNTNRLNLKVQLLLDSRLTEPRYVNETFDVSVGQSRCGERDVSLKHGLLYKDFSSYEISGTAQVVDRNDLILKGETAAEIKVPYGRMCGGDNICQANLQISSSNLDYKIIPGLTTEVKIPITLINKGEPAMQVELNIVQIPSYFELRNVLDCKAEANSYVCPIGTIIDQAEKVLIFDINLEKLLEEFSTDDTFNSTFYCEITNVGENVGEKHIVLPMEVKLQNSPFISGKSLPESIVFNASNTKGEFLFFHHKFYIGNSGPSPVKLDINFLVPKIYFGNNIIFDVQQIQGSLNGISIECTQKNISIEERFWSLSKNSNIGGISPELVNRTAIFTCEENPSECYEYVCRGDYLYKSSQTSNFEINMLVNAQTLEKMIESLKPNKDIIAIMSSAYIQGSDQRIEGHITTIMFGTARPSKVPLWVYIVASAVGVILLLLMIFALYKCHFFDRNYKKKLTEEKLLDQQESPDNAESRRDSKTDGSAGSQTDVEFVPLDDSLLDRPKQ